MHGSLELIMENTTPRPMLSAGTGSWCVLTCWSGQEWNVKRKIVGLFEVYMPVETRKLKIRGRTLKKLAPLFRNYMFVRLDLADDNWGVLGRESLKGSLGLLKNNDKPVIVPDGLIDRLRVAEAAGEYDQSGKLPFQPGDMVEITEGPFVGLIGKILRASPRKRSRLLLQSLMGEVDIGTAILTKANGSPV